MNGPRNLILAVIFVILATGFSAAASAANIYIAHNAAGGITGADCADAYAAAWFNSAANWGSNAAQIGPGTTVHLCGTFTAPAGASGYLTFQAGGGSANQITLIAEQGVILQAPYWGQNGAISTGGFNYITLNGNNNGTIEATANGTNLANQAPSCGGNLVCTSGIYAADCGNCLIENWTIANIYVNVGPSDESVAGEGSHGIFFNDGSNTTISGNTVHDMKWGISTHFCGDSNWTISNNIVYNVDHGVAVFSDDTSCSLTNLTISGNTIHDFANWDDNGNANHHDGIHISPTASGTAITTAVLDKNYIYGDPGFGGNSAWFMEGTPGTISGLQITNSLYVNTSTTHTWADSVINEGIGNTSIVIANNTLVGSTSSTSGSNCNGSTCADIAIQTHDSAGNGAIIKNNIISTFNRALVMVSSSTIPTSDYNDFYGNADVADGPNGTLYSTASAWNTYSSEDAHSQSGNPDLNGTYQLTNSSSAAWQTGVNLTSLNIANLDSDMARATRPPSSPPNWDIGAYYDSGSGDPPNPPTGLSAAVQ